MKNDIIKFVENKINSINKYYFNLDLFKDNFKFIEDIKNENLKIIENIENYFNEINFMNKIKIELFNLYNKIITPYHNTKIKQLDNYYKALEKKTTSPGIMECTDDAAVSYKVCKLWIFKCWKYRYKTDYYKINCQKNINLIDTKIKYSETDLIKETDIILNNFIKKFEKYLSNNIQYIQKLYSNLYQFVENKINNSKINKLLLKYNSLFNEIINKNYYKKILEIFNKEKIIEEKLNNSLYELEENINLLNESYFQSYFLPNFEKFIEYPEEIIFKINQFQKELIYNSGKIIKSMNYFFIKRMKNIINSTNIFITNFLNQDLKYILVNINSTYAIEKYWINICREINTVFGTCFDNREKIMKNLFYDYESLDLFLSFNNYNNSMKTIINKSLNFIFFLENLINETFIIENCKQEEANYKNNDTIDTIDNETFDGNNEINDTDSNIISDINFTFNCIKEKKHINANYSKYNYNIVKIRTGIYYTKTLFENLDEIFDEINMEDLININSINYYDNLLNDKNILSFYNETNYIFNQVIKKSELFIEESIQNLVEYIKKLFLFKNDYHLIFQKFKEILIFKNKDFENNITYIKEETINNVFLLLNQFNNTLFNQISLRDNYQFYNINETYFKEIYLYYFSLINDTFKEYKNKINSFNTDYNFHNIIKKRFKKLMESKNEYYKLIINNYSSIFNFDLLGNNYDIGEYQTNSIQSEVTDFEITKIYDYVELFETNEDSYKNKIMNIISTLEPKIKEKFENIYNYFFINFKKGTSSFVNNEYIQELKENFIFCQKYENGDIYNKSIEYIDIIFDNCSINNEININSQNKTYSLNEKITYIKDNRCLDFSVDDNSLYEEIIEFINCYNNNFYNFSVFYFNSFNSTYKEELLNYLKKIIKEIKDNYIDCNYLYEFLEKNTQLEPYENISFKEIEKLLEDIENMISIANNIYNNEIINHISNSLIYYFNSSYSDLLNNFVINELIDNITIIINNKFQIQIDYILNKIENEFHYYLLILNNTDEIGESSKKKLINLYENINKKLNETLFNLIEDNIYFYFDLFYKENKNNFINNFLNCYLNETNKYNINVNKYSNFIKEIYAGKEFNKTIAKISKDLIYNLILNKLKILINDSIYNKAKDLKNKLTILKVNMENNLNYMKIQEIPQDMLIINDLILNYTEVVNNQNNAFFFKISDKPFDLLFEFIDNNLQPPLLLIKNEYNKIEENILNDIIKIIENFPDYYSIIKNEFDFESKINNITSFFDTTNAIFMEYINILNKDLESYINKLIHYTFIDGLFYLDEPCKESFCKIDLENENNYNKTKGKETRRLHHNNNIFYYAKNNKTKYLRNLNGYNSKMGAISGEDIYSYISMIKKTILNFNNSFTSKEYTNIKQNLNLFLMKSCNLYLLKLKNNIDLVSLKFLTILTKEANNKLKIQLYKKYNEIEYYIKNNSKNIEVVVEKYLNLLNYSSNLMELCYSIVYTRANEYYQIFSEIIQGKLKYISDEEMKTYRYRILNGILQFKQSFLNNINLLTNINNYHNLALIRIVVDINNDIMSIQIGKEISLNVKYKFSKTIGAEMNLDLIEKTFSASLSLCLGLNAKFNSFFEKTKKFKFETQIIPGISFEFDIKPFLNTKICVGFGYYKNLTDSKDSYFFVDAFGEAEVGVILEAGVYIPSSSLGTYFGVIIGLKGVLGSGKIGLQLKMFFKGDSKDLFSLDLYNEIQALSLTLFAKMEFKISLGFFEFSFEFYLLNIQLIAYKKEFHKIRYYRYKDSTELKELCQEITIEGWTSTFMNEDKIKKITPCKKNY